MMMAPTKNRMRPTAVAMPISGTRMPTNSPSAPAALRAPSMVSHDSDTPTLAMLIEDLLKADEIECGRENVSGSGQNSDNEVGSKHGELQQLFCDAYDFVKMFLLLDRVEHKCRDRFAGQSETHFRSGALPASIGGIVLLGETWRPCNRPVETAVSHDFFHGERIAHVISEDETHNPIGNAGKVRGSRENDQPLHA